MTGSKLSKFIKHLNVYALSVPVGVIIANFFPLRLVIQQALIGVVLIWFYFELMLGLPFWRP